MESKDTKKDETIDASNELKTAKESPELAATPDVIDNSDSKGDSVKKTNKSFLVKYIAILLAIAFGLVLMSYLNEARLRKEQVASLKQEKEQYSISAMKDIQKLRDENKSLKLQVDEQNLQIKDDANQISALKEENDAISAENADNTLDLENAVLENDKLKAQLAAIESMMNINRLYSEGKYSQCAYEISKLENGNSKFITDLFTGQVNGPMTTKTINRYKTVRKWINRKGYLNPERISRWAAKNIK